ncbi:MAG: J domain-containing protein [Sedimentisphaerales bacterium]|nr:J domain-containing protein [Sedimentisphaerales bacterium]
MKHDPDFMDKINRDIAARKAACRILEVEENADPQQLKKAYRQAALKHHPDHNDSSSEANKKFTLIKCAYELLALDKPCDEILEEINSWPGIPKDSKYNLDSSWGRFLWWRDKFYGSSEEDTKRTTKTHKKRNSCI